MLDDALPSSAARCAFHPDRMAHRTCPRCGTFVCSDCAAGPDGACPPCAARRGSFPLSRSDCTFDKVWEVAIDRFKPNWVMLSVAVLLFFLASFASSLVVTLLQQVVSVVMTKVTSGSDAAPVLIVVQLGMQILGTVVNMLVQGFFELGLVRLSFDVLEGRPAVLGRLFSQGRRLVDLVLARLLVGLGLGAPLMFLGVLPLVGVVLASGVTDAESLREAFRGFDPGAAKPALLVALALTGVWWLGLVVAFTCVAIPLNFVIHEVVYGGSTAAESIRRAWIIGTDRRWLTFGTQFVVAAVVLGGMFACCLGILPAMAVGYLLLTTLYLALRTGAAVPAPASGEGDGSHA